MTDPDDESTGPDEPVAPPQRRGFASFRPWEIAVIVLAVVLFAVAALISPDAPDELVAPSEQPSVSASGTAAPAATATPTPSPSSTPTPTPTVAEGPVAHISQILTEEVGEYRVVDRRPSEAEASGGAVESVDLRYTLSPQTDPTDVLHTIAVYSSPARAEARVAEFSDGLQGAGFRIIRTEPLRSAGGGTQGAFSLLRHKGQSALLWSNRNVYFALIASDEVDLDAFYADLPY